MHGDRHFTADEIARLYHLTPGYVRKLASLHGWRRTGRAPVRYLIDDIVETPSPGDRSLRPRKQLVGPHA